jgi:membrane protein implicated in regulation of membrane protease activity
MESGARTAIMSYGGSAMGVATTIRSWWDVHAASSSLLSVVITLSAMSAMCWKPRLRATASARETLISSHATGLNGYGQPQLRTSESCQARLRFGGWTWRYDLTPVGPANTTVTLSYDWSAVPDSLREHIGFPPFPPEHLDNSLAHLAELVTY